MVSQVSILTMSLCASHAYRCPLHRPPGTSTLPGTLIPNPVCRNQNLETQTLIPNPETRTLIPSPETQTQRCAMHQAGKWRAACPCPWDTTPPLGWFFPRALDIVLL